MDMMTKDKKNTTETIKYRVPDLDDANEIYRLIKSSPPLDLNSLYYYLILSDHFSETSVVALYKGAVAGYISAYIHPKKADTLFVWQVVVSSSVRRQGVGLSMLLAILKRKGLEGVSWIETTVTPSNNASRKMFHSLAKRLNTKCEESTYFSGEHFGDQGHEEERLLRIGPFSGQDL
ncbi:MAG: diaminobutyrate acetyltransferase [Thermodesulfobacteriota bacterium]|nr:diaminobutyrate acetyltransferase [Thermodesulfobacteriota bacterium]